MTDAGGLVEEVHATSSWSNGEADDDEMRCTFESKTQERYPVKNGGDEPI